MLQSFLLCVVASINNLLKKSSTRVEEKRNNQGMLVDNVEKSRIYLLKSFSRLKNDESTVTTEVVETSFKYLISSAICVGMLQLFDLLAS